MKPSAELASDPEAVQSLQCLVRERLRDFGIALKAPKKRVFPVTPMRAPVSSRKVFGRPLRDLQLHAIFLEGYEVTVPRFLSSIIDYLKRHKETEGLFRKAGSTARQKALRAEVETLVQILYHLFLLPLKLELIQVFVQGSLTEGEGLV
jgi:hypothetical protein